MKKYLVKTVLVVSAVLAGMWAKAADTDLFALGGGGGNVANVLFIMDNAANFSASVNTQYCSISPAVGNTPGTVVTNGTGAFPTNLNGTSGAVEQCALYAAIGSLSTATVTLNIGIMMFNSNGTKDFDPVATVAASDVAQFNSNCAGGVGGCLVSPMVAMNPNNKRVLLEYIRKWAISGSGNFNVKANNSANGAAMQESWAYFSGKTGLSGRNYAGVLPSTPCGKNNIIFVGNDYRNNATAGDATGAAGPKDALFGVNPTAAKNATPTATTDEKASITGTIATPLCPTKASTLQTAENAGAYALNWARYMKNQGTLVYSVGILGPTCNEIYAAHLTKMGDKDVGGGKYFATTNYAELVAAIQTALSEIQSVNSVFASVSLPLNANVQGQFLNQVFIGMFRPGQDFLPRWPGNLKQYKLGFLGTNRTDLKLLDQDGVSAINNTTGFVTACARSFWTSIPNAASDTYWINAKSGDCVSYEAADSPDGAVVEKGAQATKLRAITPSSRNVKTCSAPGTFGTCTLADFATGTVAITQAMVSATSATERDTFINWIRGTNVEGELSKSTSVMRPYVHGDIVHSRPVALNYGSGQVVVFYGGNDGMLRAVNGARTATFSVSAGAELWSFMPPQFFDKIARLKNNTVPVSFPNSPAVSARAKDYGMDGPVSAFQGDVGGTNKAYVFGTMRRGGRVIYAFDVTSPSSPVGLWQKGCPNLLDDTGCSTGYTSIGQTWATLKPMFVAGYEGGATAPLLIMGGGYDNCEDFDGGAGGANHNCSTPKGNKIYVINAVTGAVVKAFDTARSVVGDPTLVTDANGKVVYAYATDLGGNIYRINFNGASTAWTNTKIAALGCNNGVSTCTANRKFEFQPSVVTTDGARYYVMVGSGEREKPVEYYGAAKSVTNYFFMVIDEPGTASWLTTGACTGSVICKDDPGAVMLDVTNIASPTAAQMSGKKGWYLGFRLGGSSGGALAGEQVVTSALTIFGTVNFSTHQPAVYGAASCKPNLGETRLYKRDYLTGKSTNGTANQFEDVAGDGLPPSPVGGQVVLDDGTIVPFCIGCSKDSPLEGSLPKPASAVIQPKNRLYWYIQK